MNEADQQATLADFWTAYDLHDRGHLEQYQDKFVAVLQGEIVGADYDQSRLRQTVSESRRVDPERIAIIQLPGQLVVVSPRFDFATNY